MIYYPRYTPEPAAWMEVENNLLPSGQVGEHHLTRGVNPCPPEYKIIHLCRWRYQIQHMP